MPFENRNKIITATSTRHWRCAIRFERSEELIPTNQADKQVLYRRVVHFAPAVYERNDDRKRKTVPKRVCERSPESHSYITERLLRK